MQDTTILRVGICSCSTHYHGQLQGRRLTVNGKRYRLHEIYVFDESQRKALKGTRCHFFLDMHTYRDGIEVKLLKNVFVSNGQNRGWKLFQGGTAHRCDMARKDKERWDRITPPAASEVINKGLRGILSNMSPKTLAKWLANATPPTCTTNF